MKNYMITVPDFDVEAAKYILALMQRLSVPAQEVQAFFTLKLSLENYIQEQENTNNGSD